MVKRLVVPIVFLVAILYCVPAFGAVAGTAHENAIGSQGVCSACHIPHKSLGARLWPVSMSGYETDFGVVGSLCYYCHGTGGGAGLPNAVQVFVMDTTTGALTHGRDADQLPSANDVVDSSLPYGGITTGSFQCTTCHNVHDDTNKPFLQDDTDQLCARCHKLRQFVGGSDQAVQGAWGAYYGTNNPGSHPMGTDVYGDSDSTANSPITITGAAVFNYAYGGTRGHNLGGHLTDGITTPGSGAGVTCATCHSVHGIQTDANPPSGGTAPVANLLTIEQPTAGGAEDGSVYNGNGDPRNALCEGCHYTTATTIDAGTGAAYGGGLRPNPGTSAYTHPVDNLGAAAPASVTAFPANWPVSSSSATNVSPVPICESCHTPHPNANSARATILAASGTHILRGSEDGAAAAYVCTQCHNLTEGAGHHPYNVAMGRMGDAAIGDGDATLECSDCHSGAHNWSTLGIGLDPDWQPAGNGRSRLASDERITTGASKECEDCHYNNNTIASPTNNSANNGSSVSHSYNNNRTSASYQDIGDATHYLGATSMDYSLGSFGGSSFNATSDSWTGQGQANSRWSRFDGNSGHAVCESCHELEADKNVPGTALLLAYHNDGGQGGNNDPSGLCEGCHGTSPGGSGTPHPMTGDTVSRTGAALTTTGSFTRGTLEGNATYPGSNALNCDSCHQPHDADTQGGTYIYDSGQNTSPAHDVTSTSQPGDSHVPTNRLGGSVVGLQDAAFCDSCHFYLN